MARPKGPTIIPSDEEKDLIYDYVKWTRSGTPADHDHVTMRMLAERVGITEQAMWRLIQRDEHGEYLERGCSKSTWDALCEHVPGLGSTEPPTTISGAVEMCEAVLPPHKAQLLKEWMRDAA